MKVCIVAGARPNFIKIASIVDTINEHNLCSWRRIHYLVVHTGQHYDDRMSKAFFSDLGIPDPDINLEVGSASHAAQTAEIMKRFEKVCLAENPTHVLVVGDVNSTIACALVSSKLGIEVIHVEAGLRSFDRSMPEEINRLLTDAISDFLFTSEESANVNLKQEGIPQQKIHFVGNVMIDTLLKHRQKAEESTILDRLRLLNDRSAESPVVMEYGLLTLHRPSNVDYDSTLKQIIAALTQIAGRIPIIFAVHPRTHNRIKEFGVEKHFNRLSNEKIAPGKGGIYCLDPLGYLDFIGLMSKAKLVLTDSGGIQEETTILGVPCVTIRENTERPVTVTHGTNRVVGTAKEQIVDGALEALSEQYDKTPVPPLWDGKAAERIVKILAASQ